MKKTMSLDLNKLVNNFIDVFFYSSDSDKSKIQFSDNVVLVTGYNGSEINKLKDGWVSLILNDDIEEYKKSLKAFEKKSENDSVDISYKVTRKDGTMITVNEKIKAIRGPDGNILSRMGMVINSADHLQEFENIKRKSEELEQLNYSKDNFISILSHDLRAPFTSILGFSEILLNESKLPEKDKIEYIKFIHDSSQNQLQLINHLFDWSQLQTGRIKLEKQSLHAQSITHNCVSYFTGLAVRKNIRINVNVPEVFQIDADERLITKLMTNLISNAVKYSPENEIVEICANTYNNELIEFLVKDNGIGIPEANREKIFNIGKVFFTPGTKGEKGSGLGLMLSKLIVEKHGGEIWFFSKEGKGSEFHFTLPSAVNTILLILQNKEKLEELSEKIQQNYSKLKVITAENAFEALEIISDKLPSLIVFEHELPLMDGLRLVNTVHEKYKNYQIPFVVFLYSDSEEFIESYKSLGVSAILQDPLLTGKFKEKLESLLFI